MGFVSTVDEERSITTATVCVCVCVLSLSSGEPFFCLVQGFRVQGLGV